MKLHIPRRKYIFPAQTGFTPFERIFDDGTTAYVPISAMMRVGWTARELPRHSIMRQRGSPMAISPNANYISQKYPTYHAFHPSTMIIVGISASTATYSSLIRLLQDRYADCSIAFIVLLTDQIASGDMLTTQLNQYSALPIVEVAEPVAVRPHYVYLVQSTGYISFTNGLLAFEEGRYIPDRPNVIGHFFQTLATHYAKRLVAMVLSGGSYDVSGLRVVRRSGGVVLAQDTQDGSYDETCDGAVQRGLIDRLIALHELSGWIKRYQNACVVGNTFETASDQTLLSPVLELCTQLGYSKQAIDPLVLAHTVARRQRLVGTLSYEAYLALLGEHPEERQHLLVDLVGNSSFCHDREAMQMLEQIVVPFLCSRSSDSPIRIWIVGCDNGDAAYFVALLLYAYRRQHNLTHALTIFATEEDESIIAMARQRSALHTTAIAALSKCIQSFQNANKHTYEINREVRASITFARHDPLHDPPLRRVDLLICPTLFFDQPASTHEHLLRTMHYSLHPDGLLLLGAWSAPQQLQSYFAPLAVDHRLYRPSANVKPFAFSSELPTAARSARSVVKTQDDALAETSLHQLYLQQLASYAPPSVLINERYDILYLSRPDERLLPLPQDAPASNLLRVLPGALLPALRVALFTALQTGRSVTTPSQQLDLGNEPHFVRIHVQLLQQPSTTQRHLLIVFHDDGLVQRFEHNAPHVEQAAEKQVQQLRQELESVHEKFAALRNQYQQTIEQQQINNADMQVMIEELTADYQEIQSINEELQVTNDELKAQNEEITSKQADFQYLLDKMNLHMLFVDDKLHIMSFTPAIEQIFHLQTADRHRPLADITYLLDYPDLLCDSERVLRSGQSRAWLARHASHDWYFVHICPCFEDNGDVSGVALLFINMHSATEAETALVRDSELFAQVVHELEHELGKE